MALVLLLAGVTGAAWQSLRSVPKRAGMQPDGTAILPTGWRLAPAGQQIPLESLPLDLTELPDGRLLVLEGGWGSASASITEPERGNAVSRTAIPDAWRGFAFAANGTVYTAGGGKAVAFGLTWRGGTPRLTETVSLQEVADRDASFFISDVVLAGGGERLWAASLYEDCLLEVDLTTRKLIRRVKTVPRPVRLLVSPTGNELAVGSWVDGVVAVHRISDGVQTDTLQIASRAADLAWMPGSNPPTLFVADSGTNAVQRVVFESGGMRYAEWISVAFDASQRPGMTPSALAVDANRHLLYVACADENAIAVLDVKDTPAKIVGYIPTARYPTAIRLLRDGTLAILNGKGRSSGPRGISSSGETVNQPLKGLLTLVRSPYGAQLGAWTRTVMENRPVPPTAQTSRTGFAPPIKHVVMVLKENRTYDQVLGDLPIGNGDRSLVMFGEAVTPNHHALARDFVLLDNFYVNAEVSADGHFWSTAAISNDYVERIWPNTYSRRRLSDWWNDFYGGERTAEPVTGHIWHRAAAAGLRMRNYGFRVFPRGSKGGEPGEPRQVADPILRACTNLQFRAYDLEYNDSDRVKVFLEDLARDEEANNMPALTLIYIGNDHTAGAAAGKRHPWALMADNDLALGLIVEGISRTKFWKDTAIFVLEDDASNGPDHVDSHRSIAYVLSPWTRGGRVDSTFYNTTSVLRTIGLLLNLPPMTQFDAAATPMWNAFHRAPDARPWRHKPAQQPLDRRNPGRVAGRGASGVLDWEIPDRLDEDHINRELWSLLRAGDPPPVRTRLSWR